MPEREEVFYFGAGPAGLPTTSIRNGASAFINFQNTGLGLAEISHRSSIASEILSGTQDRLRRLLNVPHDYEIIFAHGGGSGAFASVVYNMVGHWTEKVRKQVATASPGMSEDQVRDQVRMQAHSHLKVDYLVTGSWSLKASQEAADLLGTIAPNAVNVAIDARMANKGGKFGTIPSENSWDLSPLKSDDVPSLAFTYFCDNETVDGVEFPSFPAVLEEENRLVVADMSSNILTRAVDVSKYAAIFFGAQKNVGITDTTVIIVRKSILAGQTSKSYLISTPAVMHWPTLAKHQSLYNTLPIFSLYIALDVMEHLLLTHGPLSSGSQARLSEEKAKAIYDVLDTNKDIYRVCAEKRSRSRMNICFRIKGGDEALEKQFVTAAERWNLLGLKGHRSVGGIRISNYNSVTLSAMQKLEAYLLDFTHTLRNSRTE